VVCLFRTDIDKIERVIREEFLVNKSEDKIEGNDEDLATFGYMSRHYICELQAKHSGARYDSLKGIKFELQVRTILMDAWANVSHYLAYKGEASIPEPLRRDFYALSGLFYVADKHFELFFHEAVAEKEHVLSQASVGDLDNEPINRETVQALLAQMYPERLHARPRSVSEFVEEISSLNYVNISQLKDALTRAGAAAERMEKELPVVIVDPDLQDVPVRQRKYLDLGIARQALALADPQYEEFKYSNSGRPWDEYRKYISD
jgi:putative GTP pyrophosphokinase